MSKNTNATSPTNGQVDVIWSSEALTSFPNENCLPIIGSCQVSSILSTLENAEPKTDPPHDTFKSIPINVINTICPEEKRKKRKEEVIVEKKQLYQEIVYFGCNLCPFICTKDSKISDHIDNVHRNQENNKRTQLKCPGCTNIFYHRLSLRSHLIHDHEVGRSDINKIVNGIVYVSTLEQKKEEANKIKKDEKKVEEHFIEEEEYEREASPHAEEEDADIINDTEPKSEVTEIKTCAKVYKCYISTCSVRMKAAANITYHVQCHVPGSDSFCCPQCSENFSGWKSLQTHLWRTHSIDTELHQCSSCNYRTHSLAKLNNVHRLIHGDERPFLCDLCGKGFKNPKQLRNHRNVHRSRPAERLQRCSACGRTFADSRQLRVHTQSVHCGLRPFACDFCGYKAASNGALKLHVRRHTGERPFSCDRCEYSTSDHNSLRRHKLRHTGLKKYRCAHCDYACIQSSTYKTHLRTKHPGLESEHVFSCKSCQFRSVSADKYAVHVVTHQNENGEF